MKVKKNFILLNGQVRTIKEGVEPAAAIANLQAKGHKVQRCGKPPTVAIMEKWMSNGLAKATDGCEVELDGKCSHGCDSWMIVIGVI